LRILNGIRLIPHTSLKLLKDVLSNHLIFRLPSRNFLPWTFPMPLFWTKQRLQPRRSKCLTTSTMEREANTLSLHPFSHRPSMSLRPGVTLSVLNLKLVRPVRLTFLKPKNIPELWCKIQIILARLPIIRNLRLNAKAAK